MSWTMCGPCSSLKSLISLKAVTLTPSFALPSLIFFIATTFPVCHVAHSWYAVKCDILHLHFARCASQQSTSLCVALNTTPKVPSPRVAPLMYLSIFGKYHRRESFGALCPGKTSIFAMATLCSCSPEHQDSATSHGRCRCNLNTCRDQ